MAGLGNIRITPKAIILVVLVLLLIGLNVRPIQEIYRQSKEAAELEKDLKTLKSENEQLRTEIERLNTDAYIEQQARARLGLIKPGEKAYVIVPPKQEKPPAPPKKTTAKTKPQQNKTIFQRFYEFLKRLW